MLIVTPFVELLVSFDNTFTVSDAAAQAPLMVKLSAVAVGFVPEPVAGLIVTCTGKIVTRPQASVIQQVIQAVVGLEMLAVGVKVVDAEFGALNVPAKEEVQL